MQSIALMNSQESSSVSVLLPLSFTSDSQNELLNIKRKTEISESEFFPSSFRNLKEKETPPKTTIKFTCILEAIKKTNWSFFEKNYQTTSNKPIQVDLRNAKLNSFLTGNLFPFFLKEDLTVFLKVNSIFRKLVLEQHKWLGIYSYYKMIIRNRCGSNGEGKPHICKFTRNYPFCTNSFFSQDIISLLDTFFAPLTQTIFLSEDEIEIVAGEILKCFKWPSKTLKVGFMELPELDFRYFHLLMTSPLFNKISFPDGSFPATTHGIYDTLFFQNPKIINYSFENLIISRQNYSFLYDNMIGTNPFVKNVFYSFYLYPLQEMSATLIEVNLRGIYENFMGQVNSENLTIQYDNFVIKFKKSFNVKDSLKRFELKTLENTFEFLYFNNPVKFIFFRQFIEIFSSQEIIVTELTFSSFKSKIFTLPVKSINMLQNSFPELRSLEISGPIVFNEGALIKKFQALTTLECLSLNKLCFNPEDYLGLLQVLSKDKKLKKLTMKDIFITEDKFEKIDRQVYRSKLVQLISSLNSVVSFKISEPKLTTKKEFEKFYNSEDAESDSEDMVITINDFIKVSL